MAPSGKAPARREAGRIRGKASPSGKPEGSGGGLEEGPWREADAPSSGVSSGARNVADVVAQAAQEFGSYEVEPGVSMEQLLSDPSMRTAASRWRPTSEPRKIAALFARMLNGLGGIRPRWLEGLAPTAPPAVEALPLRSGAGQSLHESWWIRLPWSVGQRMLRCRWRTLVLAALVVCFPKVVALVVTTIMRLLVRAMWAIIARVVAELGREVHGMTLQLSMATSAVETSLVNFVEEMLGNEDQPTSLHSTRNPLEGPSRQMVEASMQQCPVPIAALPPWALWLAKRRLVVERFVACCHD